LDRGGPDGPTLHVRLHLFERTADVDGTGHFVLTNHSEVTIAFEDIDLLGMAGFNSQNVLEDFIVTEIDPSENDGRSRLVEFIASYGLGATLHCKRAVIADVRLFQVRRNGEL
jgi:hypothetical protein